MKAYPYIRVSGQSQVDGDGPERQRASINSFCRAHGIEPAQEFFEAGVSGTVESMERPALRTILEIAEPGDCVIVERLDRLARLLMVQEFFLGKCAERGLKVYCADQGLNDLADAEQDPSKKFIRHVMGAMAEWEKDALVLKLKKARERTGNFGGTPSFGDRPEEAEDKSTIMSMHALGMTYREISDHLNATGRRRRNNKAWHPDAVNDVVTGRRLRANMRARAEQRKETAMK